MSYRSTSIALAAAYAILVAYGTLYPFADWSPPDYSIVERLFSAAGPASTPDILVNFLVYLPFGFLLCSGLSARSTPVSRLLIVTLTGALLSLCLEYLQAYMPARVPSLLDFILNTVSTLVGGLLAVMSRRETRIGARLSAWRREFFKPGPAGTLGLLILACWSLSQLTPLVPSLDIGHLRDGIKPLWLTLSGQQPFSTVKALVYACQVAALSLLLERTLRTNHQFGKYRLILLALGAVLVLKIPVMSRSISLETLVGLAAGLSALLLTIRTKRRHRTYTAAFLILAAQAIDALRPPAMPSFQTHAFNWIPFHGHLSNELIGFGSILDAIWPFLALSLAIQLSYRRRPARSAPFLGGVLVFAFVVALEWLQQDIPGRYPDITTAILTLLAWSAPWLFKALNAAPQSDEPASANRHAATRPLRAVSLFAALNLGIGLTTLAIRPANLVEMRVDESKMPTHPAPQDLPPLNLPAFRYTHPRLPAPSAADIRRLQRENPSYLERHKKAAKGGAGKIGSSIIAARLDPGSIDLAKLHDRLLALEFKWRGHEQGKPLAIAYDWLYDQLSDSQRRQLRRKLIEGGQYLIERIRSTRLSPYNVYLYNSPLQALLAVSLAVYGDTPKADPIMRFTFDFWKNRTLPVWRQIMGENGGWHEGGEYVGIGIGQAVYQVPAMWRSATGEDLFDEPGIRGFLDFLVYRTRPDGTHMRWGDGAHHDRRVPDRIPLAIELRHKTAYSLGSCPERIEPTAWPWGPLPDDSLCDPSAIEQAPLFRYFDGIGLLVARSSWDDSATYLTFKAGNNYWSHGHLDQGAFTIYKGGALAIDSGAYGGGGRYGSDHHLNYSYQTVAHNLVLVSDPEDTVTKPEKKGRPPRTIANDGGQRRVGSGWGVEAAPLDLAEWERKQDIYHTATMLQLIAEPEFTVAVADLAPAYTNRFSGLGTFTHRTHRVAAFVRTLGFDPKTDIVVIHDRIKSTNPEFSKRWIMHSIGRPEINDNEFAVRINPPMNKASKGGELHGVVLLPKDHSLSALGGRGFEFFVDGFNYDNEGAVWKKAPRDLKFEPGSWRIRLTPGVAAQEDRFLVVLTPKIADEKKEISIRLLEQGNRYGCEVSSPQRTVRWWFDPLHDGPEVEVVDQAGPHARDFRVARRSDLERPSGLVSSFTRLFGIADKLSP